MTNLISLMIGELQTTAEDINHFIKDYSAIQTQLHNFGNFLNFLDKLGECENVNEELRMAAQELHSNFNSAMKYKLDNYNDILQDNFENQGEFFFTDGLFSLLPETSLYEEDEAFRFFAEEGANICKLYKAWKLGDAIGRFIGNSVIGGEDLNIRMKEMIVLRELSNAMMHMIKLDFNYTDSLTEAEINEILTDYELISIIHLRGEYCLTSIIVNDSGLVGEFSKLMGDTAEKAEKWYETQSIILGGVLDWINDIKKLRYSITNGFVDDQKETYDQVITSKVWDIYEDYQGENIVTTYAFLPDGIYYCLMGYVQSEYFYGVSGTYEIDEDEILLSFVENEETKNYSYKINIQDMTFCQTSDVGLVKDHIKGEILQLEENSHCSAEDIKEIMKYF